jgi:hypothetical protein
LIKRFLDYFSYKLDSLRYFVRSNFTKNNFSKNFFLKNKPLLNNVQKEVLFSLNKYGYAKSSINDLFKENNNYLNEFNLLVEKIKKSNDYLNSKENFKNNLNSPGKHYIHMVSSNKDFDIDPSSLLIKFIISHEIIDIINSYFQLIAKLNTADFWITFLDSSKSQRTNAQRWHRDRDDTKIVKVFLYLNEITKESGATEYLRFSRRGEKYSKLANFSYGNIAPWKVYPDQNKLNNQIDTEDLISLNGKIGTLYFVDTTGLHRGGFSEKLNFGERLFGYWNFVSPASILFYKNFNIEEKENFNISNIQRKVLFN